MRCGIFRVDIERSPTQIDCFSFIPLRLQNGRKPHISIGKHRFKCDRLAEKRDRLGQMAPGHQQRRQIVIGFSSVAIERDRGDIRIHRLGKFPLRPQDCRRAQMQPGICRVGRDGLPQYPHRAGQIPCVSQNPGIGNDRFDGEF